VRRRLIVAILTVTIAVVIAIVCIVIKLLLLFLGGVYCRRVPLTRSPCRRFQR